MTRDELFAYVLREYGTLPDYPWADSPGNAVLRHKSGKWYGIVMSVPREKLGIGGAGDVDAVNVKCPPALIGSLRQCSGYLPAWHMNKENWITILLDGSVPAEEIESLTDLSYTLTGPKKKKKQEEL